MVPADVRGLRIGHMDPGGLLVFHQPEKERAIRYGSLARPFTGTRGLPSGIPRGQRGGLVVPPSLSLFCKTWERLLRDIRYCGICQELPFKPSYFKSCLFIESDLPYTQFKESVRFEMEFQRHWIVI